MVKYNRPHYFLFVLFLIVKIHCSFGQNPIDSLHDSSLNELFDKYSKSNTTLKKIIYMQAYVKVAKNEKNRKRILAGYQILSTLNNDEKKLHYYDSIINLSKNNPIKYYPSIAYNSKAIFYHNKGELDLALENYLLSNKFAKIEKNTQLIFLNTYSIATLKRKIGEYNEALKLYRLSLTYSRKYLYKNKRNYLHSLLAMSNVFYEQKELDSAKYYNKLGVLESLKYKSIKNFHHFSANQGMIHYLEKKYDLAIDSLSKHRQFFEEKKDTLNLSYIYFYLGKSYNSKMNSATSVKYYKKIDSILNPNLNFSKEFRESYEYLINYYKEKNNLEKQLTYVNKLMYFDSITNSRDNYLSKKIFKEYDIPKLKKEKEIIKQEMKAEVNNFKMMLSFFLFAIVILILLLFHQVKTRKKYKKRFQRIINNNNNNNNNNKEKPKIDLPEDLVNEILNKLDSFEKDKKFISNKITLNSLAKSIDTNSNYLSKVINHYKKTSFSNYLNNLKIEYIIEEIKVNPILSKFTLKALALEAGFNNTESFSKAFFKLKGIKPSYFMKEFEKTNKKI